MRQRDQSHLSVARFDKLCSLRHVFSQDKPAGNLIVNSKVPQRSFGCPSVRRGRGIRDGNLLDRRVKQRLACRASTSPAASRPGPTIPTGRPHNDKECLSSPVPRRSTVEDIPHRRKRRCRTARRSVSDWPGCRTSRMKASPFAPSVSCRCRQVRKSGAHIRRRRDDNLLRSSESSCEQEKEPSNFRLWICRSIALKGKSFR